MYGICPGYPPTPYKACMLVSFDDTQIHISILSTSSSLLLASNIRHMEANRVVWTASIGCLACKPEAGLLWILSLL